MTDNGAENLTTEVIKQAVTDYVNAKHFLDESYDAGTYVVKLIKRDGKQQKHRQTIRTLDEAFEKREFERSKARNEIEHIERWFAGEQYKSYTDIDGQYILQMANERYLEEKAERQIKALEEAEEDKDKRRRQGRKAKEKLE